MGVARARSGCVLGVAVTAAAKAGSGHYSDEGWKGQGTAAEAVAGRLRASLGGERM